MATAPTPGKARKQAQTHQRIRIVVDDIEAIVQPSAYGPRDDVIVRMATKKPDPVGWGMELSLTGLASQLQDGATVGLDTICTMWWFGRYKQGEHVTLGECIDVFPPLSEVDDRVKVELVDADLEDGSPEA
jgi:hypothetical protein